MILNHNIKYKVKFNHKRRKMKNLNFEFLIDYLQEKLGEYASAMKIHEVLGMSLSYIYAICKDEKVLSRKKYGRTEYKIDSFLKVLEYSQNEKIIRNPLSKDEFDVNNFNNWTAKNDIERFLENLLLDQFGEFTSIKELVEFFGVSKTVWYDALEEGKIMYLTIAKRKIIYTRSLLPFLRETAE